jgi:hypothetical protein
MAKRGRRPKFISFTMEEVDRIGGSAFDTTRSKAASKVGKKNWENMDAKTILRLRKENSIRQVRIPEKHRPVYRAVLEGLLRGKTETQLIREISKHKLTQKELQLIFEKANNFFKQRKKT